MARDVTHRYIDPLAQLWLGCARRIGLRVERTPDAYATTDGRGTMAIGTDATLDADDSLAQMIFHELCHSLVEGEDSFARPDWGMDNTAGPDHDWREHACLRVQWVLAGRHGLRGVFAPTTDYRTAFWDSLSGDVLADRTERSTRAAIVALRRSANPPWDPHLPTALAATARIAADVRAMGTAPDSIWARVEAVPPLHPTGAILGDAVGTCGACVWRAGVKCRQLGRRVDPAWPACERHEATPAVDCQTCGACCREAYHAVEVSPKDRFVKKHPELVVLRRENQSGHLDVKRAGDRCAALAGGDGDPATRYACTVYADRPRTCRDFTLGSDNCLMARRRVGLSL